MNDADAQYMIDSEMKFPWVEDNRPNELWVPYEIHVPEKRHYPKHTRVAPGVAPTAVWCKCANNKRRKPRSVWVEDFLQPYMYSQLPSGSTALPSA